jgi:hypothetical protein
VNRLLILLCMVGWAFYIVQVNSGGRIVAVWSEQNAKSSARLIPDQKAAAPSELQPVARAAVDSPHAIVPDEAPAKPVVSSAVSPPILLKIRSPSRSTVKQRSPRSVMSQASS